MSVKFIHHFNGARTGHAPTRRQAMPTFRTQEKEFTCAYIADAGRREIFAAMSLCNPRDNFSRPKGRQIATARLVNYLEHPQAENKHPNLFFRVPYDAVGVPEGGNIDVVHPREVQLSLLEVAKKAAAIDVSKTK